MSSVLYESLVAGASGLFGAAIGVFGSAYIARQQHERDEAAENKRHRRDLGDEAARHRRLREGNAAENIDRLFSSLNRDIPEFERTDASGDAYRALGDRVHSGLDGIEAHAAYLPPEVRDRLLEYRAFLREARELAQYH